MIKVLVDTNVLIDLLAKRESHYGNSLQIFSLADTKKIEVFISTLCIANTHYMLNDVMKDKEARAVIRKFKVLVNSHSLTDKIVDLALNDVTFKDFEDGIQYYTALDTKCKAIITRNTRDFKNSKIPVLRPIEFLSQFSIDK